MSISSEQQFYPKSTAEWRSWLEQNHESEQSVWLLYYKTHSEKPSITWDEAVSEALCFGWIDSIKKTVDNDRYIQLFSKRKAKSTWSKINKVKVSKLIKNKKMAPAGYSAIETAKKNGYWTILDDVEALVIPDDLGERLKTEPNAKMYFLGLSKTKKKELLYWLVMAKKDVTRQKRIDLIIESTRKSTLPKQFE